MDLRVVLVETAARHWINMVPTSGTALTFVIRPRDLRPYRCPGGRLGGVGLGRGAGIAAGPFPQASKWRILGRLVSSDTIRVMAMTLRLTDADDRLLTERARSEGRSKQEVAREAIHAYLTDQVRRLEDLEDELALARYQLRQQLGEVTYVSQAEARSALGLPPSSPRSASA